MQPVDALITGEHRVPTPRGLEHHFDLVLSFEAVEAATGIVRPDGAGLNTSKSKLELPTGLVALPRQLLGQSEVNRFIRHRRRLRRPAHQSQPLALAPSPLPLGARHLVGKGRPTHEAASIIVYSNGLHENPPGGQGRRDKLLKYNGHVADEGIPRNPRRAS
jgi:hypothetical protein